MVIGYHHFRKPPCLNDSSYGHGITAIQVVTSWDSIIYLPLNEILSDLREKHQAFLPQKMFRLEKKRYLTKEEKTITRHHDLHRYFFSKNHQKMEVFLNPYKWPNINGLIIGGIWGPYYKWPNINFRGKKTIKMDHHFFSRLRTWRSFTKSRDSLQIAGLPSKGEGTRRTGGPKQKHLNLP